MSAEKTEARKTSASSSKPLESKRKIIEKIARTFKDQLQIKEEFNIDEALSNVNIDEKLKNNYKIKQDQQLEEDNFFLLETAPVAEDVEKKETSEENIEIEPEGKKISVLKYFDEEMQDFVNHVSKTIIERNDNHLKNAHLFYDGKEKPLESSSMMNFMKDELFSPSKPKVKRSSNHLRNILSHAKNASEWFDFNGDLVRADNPVKENTNELVLSKNEREEILTVFCKPQKLGEVPILQKSALEINDSVIALQIKEFSFSHHPLFTLETVIASRLENKYEIYLKNKIQKQSLYFNNKLDNLLQKKKNIEKSVLNEENNRKMLYKNQEYRECIKGVTKTRNRRFAELTVEKKLENDVIVLWKLLKDVRKNQSFISTSLNIEIIKTDKETESERKRWEEMFNLELHLSIEQLKCDFIDEKLSYRVKSSEDRKKTSKPSFKYDDAKIRTDLYKQMCSALRNPGEPDIIIKLTKTPNIITKTVADNLELKRRSEVEKIKLFFKVYANDKEICKSKMVHIEPDFVAKFDEVLILQLDDNIVNLKIILFEQNFIRTSHSIAEIVIDIPRKKNVIDASTKTLKFNTNFNKKYSVGIGNGKAIFEIAKIKYPQFKDLDMTVLGTELLTSEGVLLFNISWERRDRRMEENTNRTITKPNVENSLVYEQQSVPKILNLLFDNMLDPNDPENAFLFKFMNNCDLKQFDFKNFYFDESIYLTFKTNETLNEDRNSKRLSDVDIDHESVTSRDTYSKKADNNELEQYNASIGVLLDPLEVQRKMSKKYLELMNTHLSNRWQASFTDKQLSDIMTAFKYPGLRSITLNFLRPKQPLFHHTKLNSSPKLSYSNVKDYYLKVCVLKAFQLPNRSYQLQPTQDDDALKLVTLRPFIHINCQGKHQRTTTVLGSNPTWNEELVLPVSYNMKSTIVINLFDELYEDLLDDDRLEKSTIHYRYNINWLASSKISLLDMFSQGKVEGTFGMSTPPELLSYKYNIEGKRPSLHVASDNLRRDFQMKQREGIFISLRLEMFPSFPNPQNLILSSLESNEMDYVVKYLKDVSELFTNQFPKRKCNLLIVDTSGKTICITRFLQPLALPEFGEYLKTLFSSTLHNEGSQSSKGSTPSKNIRKASRGRFEKDEMGTRSMQSTFSLNEGRRFSKSTKDTFELKSVDENFFDSIENDMSYKMQMCARFVSLIPLYESDSRHVNHVTLLGMQTVKLVTGSLMDHSILLMSYFIQLGIDCWILSGMALPRGFSSYVLVRECNNAIQLTNDTRYPAGMKSNVRHFIYDAVDGSKYDVKDPFCPLQCVYFVCNQENIWLNIQAAEQSDLIRLNFANTSDWRPVFQKNKMACPGPLSGLANTDALYNYDIQDVKKLKDAIEQKVKFKIQKWRGHRKTSWNRYCSSILQNSLMDWEKFNLIPFSTKPKPQSQMQQLLLSYQVFGFPLNFPYSNITNILSAVKGTQIHMDDRNDIEYALGVEVFPYPNGVYSIWVYLATVAKK